MNIALILLPIILYILLTLIFVRKPDFMEILEAFVKGHLVLFTFIAVSTELLSLADGIFFSSILTVWLLFMLVCLVITFRHRRRFLSSWPGLPKTTLLTKILFGFIVFILVATLDTAIVYPPNNVDSLIYHMARVAHWINNHNVSFYPTAIENQLFMMPLAEFAIMHVQILTGSDLFANLVQWMSFCTFIPLGALIGSELGLSSRKQVISVTVIATLPMAILQASSTQNDLVVSSFIMSFALFMLRLRDDLKKENLFFAAISLGLALLTKGTAYIYCAAIGLSLAVPVLLANRNDSGRFLKTTASLILIAVFALLLNAGHLWRNYHLYGNPLPKQAGFVNEEKSLTTLVSNILRNGALHLVTPSRGITEYQEKLLYRILGPELANPKTTFGDNFGLHYISRKEDYQGNLLHMPIVLFAVVLLPVMWWKGRYRKAVFYATGILLGALLYCWFLKWQIWASRLHTPLFALAAPLLAIVIPAGTNKAGKVIGHVLVFCMVFYSFQFALANRSRSFVSLDWYKKDRFQNYFNRGRNRFYDYKTAMITLYTDFKSTTDDSDGKNNVEIGLYLNSSGWEYPFWVFAGQAGQTGYAMSFRHVGVDNVSRTIENNDFSPRYVIGTKPLSWEHAPEYKYIYKSKQIYLLKKSVK